MRFTRWVTRWRVLSLRPVYSVLCVPRGVLGWGWVNSDAARAGESPRRFVIGYSLGSVRDELDCVANGLEVLDLFVRDGHLELLLGVHNDSHH